MNIPRAVSNGEEAARESFREGLQRDMSQLPAEMSRGEGAAQRSTPGVAGCAPMTDELSSELYALLRKYVVLLERSNGAYSVRDERDVERVLRTLAAAGWTIPPSDHGELDGDVTGAGASALVRALSGRPSDEHAEDFQWGRDSAPDSVQYPDRPLHRPQGPSARNG